MNNKELVQQYCIRLWEQRDLTAIDDYFAADATPIPHICAGSIRISRQTSLRSIRKASTEN